MLTKKAEAPGLQPGGPQGPRTQPATTITEATGFAHSDTEPGKSRVLASQSALNARRVASTVLFFSAAGCAVFGVLALGADILHAGLAFTAMIALWILGEVVLP